MTKFVDEQERWISPTSVTLVMLVMVYFFVLFPGYASGVLFQYLNYFILLMIAIMTISLIAMIYRKIQKIRAKAQKATKKKHAKHIKSIEQLIWRNRFVLQTKQLNFSPNAHLDNQKKWEQEKRLFCQRSVFSIVSEKKVSFEEVSTLIEKALRRLASDGLNLPLIKSKT